MNCAHEPPPFLTAPLVNAYFKALSISRLIAVSFLQPTSEDFVSRSIRLLKTNMAVGLDNNARLLKDSVDVITFSLNKFLTIYIKLM